MQRSLPRRGAATHHAWLPGVVSIPGGEQSSLGGRRAGVRLTGLVDFANVTTTPVVLLFSPEPSGKPAGPNGHTRRTASFHTPSGRPETPPLGRPMA